MRPSQHVTAKSAATLLIVPAVVALILCVTGISWAQTDRTNQPPLRTLTAFGNGEVRVRPDLAEVRLGVETEAPTAEDARRSNAEKVNRVIAAVKAAGIPQDDIRTSTFQLYPVRRSDQPAGTIYQGEPPIVGYDVTNIISVSTGNFDLVPKIIDTSIKAGANRVESVNFSLRNDTDARQTALRRAVASARRDAQTMAKELGVSLARVQSVQEGGGGVVPPVPMFAANLRAEAAPTPILPGEITVNASVTLTYVIQ